LLFVIFQELNEIDFAQLISPITLDEQTNQVSIELQSKKQTNKQKNKKQKKTNKSLQSLEILLLYNVFIDFLG